MLTISNIFYFLSFSHSAFNCSFLLSNQTSRLAYNFPFVPVCLFFLPPLLPILFSYLNSPVPYSIFFASFQTFLHSFYVFLFCVCCSLLFPLSFSFSLFNFLFFLSTSPQIYLSRLPSLLSLRAHPSSLRGVRKPLE